MPAYVIRVTLEVKADTATHAEEYVQQRLVDDLNAWFTEHPRTAPYPNGSLLYWNIRRDPGTILRP